MKRHILIICILSAILPLEVLSNVIHSANERDEITALEYHVSKQDRPKGKEVKTKKAAIKEVPKSRKQVKPTVVKPKTKGKPVKINRPKIKKP